MRTEVDLGKVGTVGLLVIISCVVVLRQRRGASTCTNTLTILVSFHIIYHALFDYIQFLRKMAINVTNGF